MITSLEEFRCPEFQIAHDGQAHLVFWPGDTIGEPIDAGRAMSLALSNLGRTRPDPLFERRMLPAMVMKYRPTVPAKPRHIDDEA